MPASPSPNTRRATAMPPEERRAAIVAATEPLLAEIGQRVTTRQIAEAAGIAEGTIFRVFSDKDELIAATYQSVVDRSTVEAALADVDPATPFRTRLVVAVEAVRDKVLYVWRLHSNLSPEQRSLQPRPLQVSDALVAMLEAEKDRFRVPATEAARLLVAITLATTHPTLAPEPGDPEDIVDLILDGIGAR